MTRALARRGHHRHGLHDRRAATRARATAAGARIQPRCRRSHVSQPVQPARLSSAVLYARSVSRAYLRTAVRSFDIAHLHACHNLPGAIAAAALARAACRMLSRRTARRCRSSGGSWRNGHLLPLRGGTCSPARRGCSRSPTSNEQQLTTLGVPRSRIVVVPNPSRMRVRQGRTRFEFRQRAQHR